MHFVTLLIYAHEALFEQFYSHFRRVKTIANDF